MELFESFLRKKLIHNYFPAPKLPFVINLASTNQDILKQSIEHCKQNILRTSKLKLPFYAVHAGFCLDPQIVDLGKKIISKEKINRKINMEIFMESLKELLEYSNKNNVELSIENNVISKENYESNYHQNIFLCTDYNEIKNIMDEFKHMNLGILLDTGHLKVSSMTLNLDDGLTDLNSKIDHSYWFLPFMKDLNVVAHVVEVKNIIPKIVLNQIQILKDGI
jgi:sugar phosphate isomerase/epimerase